MGKDPSQMSPEELEAYYKKNCIFCKIVGGEIPSNSVFEDDVIKCVLDINPAVPGHTLIVPKKHFSMMPILPADVFKHMFGLTRDLCKHIKKALVEPKSEIFIANGGIAGQQSPHFLFHIFPGGCDSTIIENKHISESDILNVLEPMKNNLNIMMNNHFKRERVVKPEFKSDVSKSNIVKVSYIDSDRLDLVYEVLHDSSDIQNLIVTMPDKFKGIVESNPQLKSVFDGFDIDRLSLVLKNASPSNLREKLNVFLSSDNFVSDDDSNGFNVSDVELDRSVSKNSVHNDVVNINDTGKFSGLNSDVLKDSKSESFSKFSNIDFNSLNPSSSIVNSNVDKIDVRSDDGIFSNFSGSKLNSNWDKLMNLVSSNDEFRNIILESPDDLKSQIGSSDKLRSLFDGVDFDEFVKTVRSDYGYGSRSEVTQSGGGIDNLISNDRGSSNLDSDPFLEFSSHPNLINLVKSNVAFRQVILDNPEDLKLQIPTSNKLMTLFNGVDVNRFIEVVKLVYGGDQ